MGNRVIMVFLAVAVMTFAAGFSASAAQAEAAPSPGWLERDTLIGDWGGRHWLKERGITLMPRFTQFYQGMTSGDDDSDFEYGSKADVLLDADLTKLGFWKGLSLTVHAEYNFGESVNGRGGTVIPVNTALAFPGIEGQDAYDFSSVYFKQKFGDSISLSLGKINIVDVCAVKPFHGGDGIDSFWNATFVVPPSGTVPPYIFGAMLSVRTEAATYGLWVYDPNSAVNKSGFENPFNNVTIRGNVSFPVTIAGLSGHQGFATSYSTQPGTDLETLDEDIYLPTFKAGVKNDRYYVNYTFDQYLYQKKENPDEGVGLFGQFGISDGNPNKLYWSAFGGLQGTGLIPGRSRDNWGAGYYYDAWSSDMKDSLRSIMFIRDEQAWEFFYNFSVAPWLTLGADLQIITPGLSDDTAVFSGLRTVIRF
jgi:porin